MHTVEMLDHALMAAARLGFQLRQDWLAGPGGLCEINGEPWIFLDLGADPEEQLEQVVEALRGHSGVTTLKLPVPLQSRLETRRAA